MFGVSGFGILIIVLVTIAEIAGRNKRAKELFGEERAKREELKKQKKQQGTASSQEDKLIAEEKFIAEETPASFEVNETDHSDVQGFDVK